MRSYIVFVIAVAFLATYCCAATTTTTSAPTCTDAATCQGSNIDKIIEVLMNKVRYEFR